MKIDEEYNFFIICPLGLESLCLEELHEKKELFNLASINSATSIPGGIKLKARADEGLALNRVLRIPTRILLRLDSFLARDIPKLFNKITQIKWNEYIYSNDISFKVSCKKSRLMNTKNIEIAALDGITKYFKDVAIKKKFKETPYTEIKHVIYINFDNDTASVSIDTSGEPLYKRGALKEKGRFSLRENFAAGCLYKLRTKLKVANTFLDPMCGSGTILYEALNLYSISKRDFNYIFFTKPALKKILPIEPNHLNAYGSDIDDELFKSARMLNINIQRKDVFNINEKYDLILTHPPYGKNVQIKSGDEIKLFTKLGSLSKNAYFIIDNENFIKIKSKIKVSKILDFNNQGIKTVLGKINN
jgi:putative N6-adenine-specific DNA methylase